MKKLFALGNTMKILYVEDDKCLQKHTTSLLNDFFAKIDTADNGKEGLAKFKEAFSKGDGYDLIITDINMPDLDGLAMIEEILRTNSSQAIVVMSAPNESEYTGKLIELGVESFAVKPINLLQLVTTLSLVTQLVQLRNENSRLRQELKSV